MTTPYIHKVQYYETDKMGITHHSNYIRWMEEARVDFLEQIGWSFTKLEEVGIVSPVVGVNCTFKTPSTFSEEIEIEVTIKEFKGVKLFINYLMKNSEGKVVAEGDSVHCFLTQEGTPVRLAKEYPDFYQALMDHIS